MSVLEAASATALMQRSETMARRALDRTTSSFSPPSSSTALSSGSRSTLLVSGGSGDSARLIADLSLEACHLVRDGFLGSLRTLFYVFR